MSFLDDIVSFGKDIFTGNSIGSQLAKTAALGLMLNQLNKSVNKGNDTPAQKDPGVRIQLDPDTNNSIPVVYGKAYIPGIVTDAALTNGNLTMWYCLTLCEKTGIKLSDDANSEITLKEVYWNGLKMDFQADGVTASQLRDESGNTDTDINGLVKVYFFKNGSNSPAYVETSSSSTTLNAAYTLFPNWNADHEMSNLAFVLVRVDYNKEKNVTGLPEMMFYVSNSMFKAGDCINDYMTNTKYGAAIAPEEIYSE